MLTLLRGDNGPEENGAAYQQKLHEIRYTELLMCGPANELKKRLLKDVRMCVFDKLSNDMQAPGFKTHVEPAGDV